MNYQAIFILALSVLFLFASMVNASPGPDYEAQFNHSAQRWLQEIEYYRPVEKPIGLIYVCKNVEDRDKLASEYRGQKQLKSEEKLLAYEARLVVFHFEKPSKENQLSWLRRNFFLGIAYRCVLDGFQ